MTSWTVLQDLPASMLPNDFSFLGHFNFTFIQLMLFNGQYMFDYRTDATNGCVLYLI